MNEGMNLGLISGCKGGSTNWLLREAHQIGLLVMLLADEKVGQTSILSRVKI